MKIKYFVTVRNGNTEFNRGLWDTIEETTVWINEYFNENPDAIFQLQSLHVMWNQ